MSMFRTFLLVTALLFITAVSRAQFDSSFIKKNIRHCADSLAHGFKTRNWDLFTRYSYPALIGSMGGKKEFINYVSTVFSQAPESAWKQYENGRILQVVKKGTDFQAIIELLTVIEWQGNRISTVSHLVGESWDGGLFWTFFDSQGDRQACLHINPHLSEDLVIPQREEKKELLAQPKSNQ